MKIFVILLFVSIIFCQETKFMIMGLSTNMTVLYGSKNNCGFLTCQKIICDILNNTTSAYVAIYPIEKITSCPKFSSNFNVNMISFIFKANEQIISPFACYTIGDCMEKSCNLYLSSKESYFMAFTGQCLM